MAGVINWDNPEEVRNYYREYYAKNIDKKRAQSRKSEAKRREDPGYRKKKNDQERKRRREASPELRERINRREKEKRRRKKLRNRSFINRILRRNPCVDCGYSDIKALEFDHVSGQKTANISQLIHKGCSMSKLKEELRKCRVRCANCHTIKSKETGFASSVPKPIGRSLRQQQPS